MFGESDEDTNTPQLSINQKYAEAYDKWRGKEELQKLKDKYGNDAAASEGTSSDTESDDLDEKDLDPKLEKTFLTVLSALKSKDPSVYDKSVKFYDEEDENGNGQDMVDDKSGAAKICGRSQSKKLDKKLAKKDRPMFLKEYERRVIVDKKGELVDEVEVDRMQNFDELPYVEQQENLKRNFKMDQNQIDLDDDDFLKPRFKNQDEQTNEEESYLAWLKGQKADLNAEKDLVKLKSLRDFWNNPNLEKGERFLKDFILNRRYLEEDSYEQGESARIPTYDEIVDHKKSNSAAPKKIEDLDEDEKLLEAQEQFEHKYNFRFEEPDDDFVKSYPRTVKDSLRRKTDKGKKKREEYRERKEKEKEQKRQEIKRLKNLKRREIVEKIKKVKQVTGNDDLPLDPEEFERDFNPAEYDRLMASMFNEKYYEDGENEDEKPVFSSDSGAETDEDQVDKMVVASANNQSVMENANPPEESDEEIVASTSTLKKSIKRKVPGDGEVSSSSKSKDSKFLRAVKRKKPLFDPSEKTFEQYFDEYYKLDYEDIIGGDTICRFKYRKVTPNDFGLSVDEILSSNPKELNAWVSVKKMSQYRSENDEVYDLSAYKKKADDLSKKQNILFSFYNKNQAHEEPEAASTAAPSHKPPAPSKVLEKLAPASAKTENQQSRRQRKNARQALSVDVSNKTATSADGKVDSSPSNATGGKSKSQKVFDQLSDDRLKAYGINPKKLRNKMKYSAK